MRDFGRCLLFVYEGCWNGNIQRLFWLSVKSMMLEVWPNCGPILSFWPIASVVGLRLPPDLMPDSSLCQIELLVLRPFLDLLILPSFMTQLHPYPSVTLPCHLLSGSNPVGRLGSSGTWWCKKEPHGQINPCPPLAPLKGQGWRNHGDSHCMLQIDLL